MPVDLRVRIGDLELRNPVIPASGCFAYGRELAHLYPLAELGALVTKGLSPEPWTGNPGQRIVETPAGLLNAIGLQNPGVDAFLEHDWPWLRQQDCPVLVNVIGKTVEEYVEVIERLNPTDIAGFELNISCPNIKAGGIQFGSDPRMAAAITATCRRAAKKPLWVKLSPNVTDIGEFARAVEAAGADALSVANTFLGMAIDIQRRRPVLGIGTGGLSGPAIKPIALRLVWQAAAAVSIPVIGIGGIMTGEDAVEFLLAGAVAVQVGTANFVNPRACPEIRDGIARYLEEQGCRSVGEIVGAARPALAR